MKIYISGKITGLDTEICKVNFEQAEEVIRAHGHEPVNPLKIHPHSSDMKWVDYMKSDIKALMDCDALYALRNYALRNYADSIGSQIEIQLARDLQIPVYTEEDTLWSK